MKKTKHCVWMVICFLTINHAIAQKATELKTKFGKLSAEEMKMTVYDKYPEANAVILFDKASLDYDLNGNGYFDCSFRRHVRIKILKKEGYNEADVLIPHSEHLKIYDLKASAHNLEDNKWVETKMKDASVFDDKLNKWTKLKKFTIPQVREGSIIEYQYRIFDDGGGYMPPVWMFQHAIPIIWSEYEVNIPQYYDYIAMPQGSFPFLVKEDREEATDGFYKSTRVSWYIRHQRWVQQHLPAVQKEPMMTSPYNYYSRLTFQYKGFYQLEFDVVMNEIRIRQGIFRPAANTWSKLGSALMKDEDFGDVLTHKATLKKAKSLTDSLKSDKEKIAAIYEYIGKNYEVESYRALTLVQPFNTLLDKQKGAVTELNLLAINLLRHAGVEAYPVIMSTRSNGQLNPFYPMTERVDRVITYLPMAEKESFFMDVSAYPMPLGLLPFEDLNGEGFVMKDKAYQWIALQNKLSTKSLFLNSLIINDKGELSGTIEMSSTGYNSFKGRTQIEKEGAENYVNGVLKDL